MVLQPKCPVMGRASSERESDLSTAIPQPWTALAPTRRGSRLRGFFWCFNPTMPTPISCMLPPALAPQAPPGAPSVSATGMSGITADALARAAAIAAKFGGSISMPGASAGGAGPGGRPALPAGAAAGFEAELEINDFPQHARWKITHRETMNQVNELTGAALTVRGTYVAPGRPVPEGASDCRNTHPVFENPNPNHNPNPNPKVLLCLKEGQAATLRIPRCHDE